VIVNLLKFWINLNKLWCIQLVLICGGRYTLWNAEYRISLMRNFDIPSDNLKGFNSSEEDVNSGSKSKGIEGGESGVGVNMSSAVSERMDIQALGNLSPEALKYVQQLEEELSSVKQVKFFLFVIYSSDCQCLIICELLACHFLVTEHLVTAGVFSLSGIESLCGLMLIKKYLWHFNSCLWINLSIFLP